MKCPFCNNHFEGIATYCPKCGRKLSEIIREEIQQALKSDLKELDTPGMKSERIINQEEKPQVEKIINNEKEPKRAEYKKFLKELFSNRNITPEEIILIGQKFRDLGLGKIEALSLQKEVAKELGIDIQEEEICRDVILEINTGRTYFQKEMNSLEFSIRSRSMDNLENISLSGHLKNLKKTEVEHIGLLRPLKQKEVFLPFQHDHSGQEIVKILLSYCDSKGNPSIYETEFEVEVFGKGDEKSHKSISISITAEKIMGSDFSHMAEIHEEIRRQETKSSFLHEGVKKEWMPLVLFLNEEERDKRRKELSINKTFKEGENYFNEGLLLKAEGERLSIKNKNSAREAFNNAINLFKKAEDCFVKVRENDSDHASSLEKIKTIREFYAEIGSVGEEPTHLKIRLSSGHLTLADLQKKIYLYSKKKISLGRDTKNDLILNLFPNQWKGEYDEEVRKILREKEKPQNIPDDYFPNKDHKKNLIHYYMISRRHAEILEKTGSFYLRDIGSTNGTFVDGKKLKINEEFLLKDNSRISIASVLDLECKFFGEFKKTKEKGSSFDSCFTVLGEKSDSCFGIDKKGTINAIRLKRINNDPEGEEYLILVREATIGSSRTNAIVIDSEKVSDIHAKIFYRDEQYWIEDLNSRYGTRVNGKEIEPLTEVSLGERSEILVGDTNLRFEGIYR